MPDMTLRSIDKNQLENGKNYLFINNLDILTGTWVNGLQRFICVVALSHCSKEREDLSINNVVDIFEIPTISKNHSTLVP